jgi:hypothetical protein
MVMGCWAGAVSIQAKESLAGSERCMGHWDWRLGRRQQFRDVARDSVSQARVLALLEGEELIPEAEERGPVLALSQKGSSDIQ